MRKSSAMLLGFTIPKIIAESCFPNDTAPAVQTYKFSWSFVKALEYCFSDVTLLSTCPVQNFPANSKILFGFKIFKHKNTKGYMLPFVNILLFKHITRFISCVFIAPFLLIAKRIDFLLIHGVHSPFLLFGFLASMVGVHVTVILTDPPGVILPTDRFLSIKLKEIDALIIRILLSRVSAVISLSPQLANELTPNKPTLIFPGILDSSSTPIAKNNTPSYCPFTVVYAGGLSAIYGIDTLIAAVKLITEIPIRLCLYGMGDQVDKVKEIAATDSRFFYGGFVGGDPLKNALAEADLLINPRPTHYKFAAQSFPSKLIEYISMRRPVLTTRIPSIPESLSFCFYYIDNETPEGIKNAILSSAMLSEIERDAHSVQALKILEKEFSDAAVGIKIFNHLQSTGH